MTASHLPQQQCDDRTNNEQDEELRLQQEKKEQQIPQQENEKKKKKRSTRISSFMFWSANLYPSSDDEENNNNNNNNNNTSQSQSRSPYHRCCCTKLLQIYNQYEFLILIILAICLARAYPPLGADYLQPQITSSWIAVIFIFLLAGFGLKTEEFAKAFQRLYFNVFVQIFSFGVDSAVVFGVSRALLAAGALSIPLANGMVVCASLSMTINMVLVLTKSSGGDEASAIFNSAVGNMIGVFLTPLLVLGYLGVTGEVAMGDVFYKLAVRVVCPILVGQILRKLSPAAVEWYKKHKQFFKQAQQLALVFIVYTVFCETFTANMESDDDTTKVTIVDIVVMVVVEFGCLVGLMLLAWISLRVLFRNEPRLRVMGLFGCTHKTVAMGIPLINAIYEDDAFIGLITLPLLIWHTMQLILGSFLAPKLAAWVVKEEERLGISDDNNDNDDNNVGNDSNDNQDGINDDKMMDETGRISSLMEGSNDTQDSDKEATATTPDIEQGQSDEESL
ncbi:bile acid:sodium symporter [Nitzschia inconspicua]|uniref:Bile acid:sodium symporter n=1 Tax=Nitzschia inconspicua TaxID=303405 RepID=A0A9K3K860_9STRA|nr:bile acid:sodium symporter [Nitzschia inconspicua]KAG7373649.1 bile acid:sodium symporter [Nitzschia inconspicua]